MLRHFHELVLSYEVKAMKPQPEIYHEAPSRSAGCRPEECFYTDDIAGIRGGGEGLGDRCRSVRIGWAVGAGTRNARNSVEVKS